jgi:hypothetical protein
MKVYAAINAVQKALSHTGIAKDRTNTQGAGYKFRGIDDVYNAVAPLLAEHGLCIVPRFISRTCDERLSKQGGALFYVTVEAEFDFISSEDGSKHTARTFGEAMDSGDKATNKAMSAAYKYAAFQTFAIPTEGNPDADAETHEVQGERLRQRAEWLETTAMQLEGCESADELKGVWSAAVKVTKAEGDTDAYATLKPVMERMAALIKEQTPEKA